MAVDLDTKVLDSDEFKEMFCEQCEAHGINAIASGFCVDCNDYMCATCLMYHIRYVPEHTQLDEKNMPQDFCLEKCDKHQNKVIKFYCEACQDFPCATCKQESHNNCQLSHIPSLVHNNDSGLKEEVSRINEKIKDLSKTLDKTKDQINKNVSKIVLQEKEAKSTIEQGNKKMRDDLHKQCQKIIEEFDQRFRRIVQELQKERQEKLYWISQQKTKFETTLAKEVKTVKDKIKQTVQADKTKLNILDKDCCEILNNLKSLHDHLKVKQEIGKASLFIATKKMKPVVSKCQERIKDVNENNAISYFDIDSENVELTSEPNHLTIDMIRFDTIDKPKHANVALIPKPNLSMQVEKSSLSFTSLCLFSESKLAVANYKHSNVLLYHDFNQKTAPDIIPLSGCPWDITNVSANRLAVTLPDAKKIQFIEPSCKNTNSKDLNVGGTCHGVVKAGASLIVSFINPAQIKVIDFNGTVKRILVNASGDQTFFSPLCLALNEKLSIIYVSDSDTSEIVSMNFDGKINAIYKDDQLTSPLHMAVDGTGSIYVCGRYTNNVMRLSHDLREGSAILDKCDVTNPVSVAFCTMRNRLFVGTKSESVLKVYKIKEV